MTQSASSHKFPQGSNPPSKSDSEPKTRRKSRPAPVFGFAPEDVGFDQGRMVSVHEAGEAELGNNTKC